ncbi:unnamed protein product [Strongylus vulgaris]|uniref:EF-hand domain-containing protein n=1 Tax=Strongylus vulgaris TaxID=40348 RepID=A0A3P7LTK6_STRVU|nr:unnamed protein product [Strongylus vulgaris]
MFVTYDKELFFITLHDWYFLLSFVQFVEGLSHFDKEGNGLINVAELRHLLTTLGFDQFSILMKNHLCHYCSGERLSDEEVDQLLAGHNDSHGNVNIADFVRNVMNS